MGKIYIIIDVMWISISDLSRRKKGKEKNEISLILIFPIKISKHNNRHGHEHTQTQRGPNSQTHITKLNTAKHNTDTHCSLGCLSTAAAAAAAAAAAVVHVCIALSCSLLMTFIHHSFPSLFLMQTVSLV